MLNRVFLQGRLVMEPELKKTAVGTSFCSVPIAVTRDVASKETGERLADFIDVIAWSGNAEFLTRHWHKGDMIIVQGRLQTKNWTDKEGNKRKGYDVVAEYIYFSGSKRKDLQLEESSNEDLDLPF